MAAQIFCIVGLAVAPVAISATCLDVWGPLPDVLAQTAVLVSLAMAMASLLAAAAWQAWQAWRHLHRRPSAPLRSQGWSRWISIGFLALGTLMLIGITLAWPWASTFSVWAALGPLLFVETMAVAVQTAVLAALRREVGSGSA